MSSREDIKIVTFKRQLLQDTSCNYTFTIFATTQVAIFTSPTRNNHVDTIPLVYSPSFNSLCSSNHQIRLEMQPFRLFPKKFLGTTDISGKISIFCGIENDQKNRPFRQRITQITSFSGIPDSAFIAKNDICFIQIGIQIA